MPLRSAALSAAAGGRAACPIELRWLLWLKSLDLSVAVCCAAPSPIAPPSVPLSAAPPGAAFCSRPSSVSAAAAESGPGAFVSATSTRTSFCNSAGEKFSERATPSRTVLSAQHLKILSHLVVSEVDQTSLLPEDVLACLTAPATHHDAIISDCCGMWLQSCR